MPTLSHMFLADKKKPNKDDIYIIEKKIVENVPFFIKNQYTEQSN